MNESLPPAEEQKPTPPKSSSAPAIAAGFVIGAALWSGATIRSETAIPFALFDCFALPVIALILASIRSVRGFGLGLLIASGLGWLVLGAICGGLIK